MDCHMDAEGTHRDDMYYNAYTHICNYHDSNKTFGLWLAQLSQSKFGHLRRSPINIAYCSMWIS